MTIIIIRAIFIIRKGSGATAAIKTIIITIVHVYCPIRTLNEGVVHDGGVRLQTRSVPLCRHLAGLVHGDARRPLNDTSLCRIPAMPPEIDLLNL